MTPVSRTVEVVNKRGLHARASAKFVTMAAQIDAAVEVEKDGNKVVTRVGYRFDDEGNKIRVAKRTGEDI